MNRTPQFLPSCEAFSLKPISIIRYDLVSYELWCGIKELAAKPRCLGGEVKRLAAQHKHSPGSLRVLIYRVRHGKTPKYRQSLATNG